MSTQGMSLAEMQREMAAAIMTPLTADEAMRSHTPEGRSTEAIAKSLIAPNSRLTAFERLEIYNRQYWFRVLDSLAEDFRALRVLLGSELYDALAVAYLTAHPNRSFTLRNLGSQMVEWLTAHPEFAGRRHQLAVDVARVEWAFIEAFDHAKLAPLTANEAAALGPDSRLRLQPHLQLIALEYPADDLVLNLHDRQKREASEAGLPREEESAAPLRLGSIRRRATWLAVHRVELSVYYRRLRREEYQALVELRDARTLAEAIDAGFEGSSIAVERRPKFVSEWFAHWSELGWICVASR